MEIDVTLVLKKTYDTGKESDERQQSAGQASFVRVSVRGSRFT